MSRQNTILAVISAILVLLLVAGVNWSSYRGLPPDLAANSVCERYREFNVDIKLVPYAPLTTQNSSDPTAGSRDPSARSREPAAPVVEDIRATRDEVTNLVRGMLAGGTLSCQRAAVEAAVKDLAHPLADQYFADVERRLDEEKQKHSPIDRSFCDQPFEQDLLQYLSHNYPCAPQQPGQ